MPSLRILIDWPDYVTYSSNDPASAYVMPVKMEARQRHIDALAAVDRIPVHSRTSSSNPYQIQPSVNNIRFNEDYRGSFHLEPSTPDDDDRYYSYSDESPLPGSLDEDISPSSSVIDAMEKLFIDYSQTETRNNTANSRYDQLTRSSVMRNCETRARHPAEESYKTSKGVTLTEPFVFIWPKFPSGMQNSPMIAKWEVCRIAYHCSLSPEDVSLEYLSQWRDQEVFWKDMKQHSCFRHKTLPAKCNREVWDQGHGQDLDMERAVEYKAKLSFSNPNRKPTLEVEIPVLGQSCRLRRKFGFNRFIELQLLFKDGCTTILKNKDEKRALARWLVQERHSFLSQEWVACFIEEIRSKKRKQGLAAPKITGKRVVLFAEHVAGLNMGSNMSARASQINHQSAFTTFDSFCDRHTDIESPNGTPMNDGIGRISYSLLSEVRDVMGLDFLPTAIQARIGGAKGLWMMDSSPCPADERWIEIYPSQQKWDCNWSDPDHRTLEVVSVSSYTGPAALNLQFIPILEERAIDRKLMRTTIYERIDKHLRNDLDNAKAAMEIPEVFRRWIHETSCKKFGDSQDDTSWFVGGLPGNWPRTMSFLADGGFDPRRLEFLNNMMFDHQKQRWKQMETKLHIRIAKSTLALMTIDFQGVLAPNEVQLCFSPAFDDGQQTLDDLGGFDVLVGRCPAHLPSDIQKVKAVFKPELRHFKNVVMFSSLGDEPLANKLSGGDYDGDKAWICWDPDIVDNFKSTDVLSPYNFKEYFQPNIQTLGSLASRYGTPHYLNIFLEEAFDFHLNPSFMGICTGYKESLAYHEGSVGNETVVKLSMLLSALVDQEESGFEFDDNIWCLIKEEQCGGKMFLKAPAYKTDDFAALATSNHVIDFLKLAIHQRIQDGIREFSNYRTDSGIGYDKPVVTTFDSDLVSYWNDFEERTNQMTSLLDPSSCWFKDFRSRLNHEIDECQTSWGKAMAGKEHYSTKVIPIHERWKGISPTAKSDSPVASLMASSLENGVGGSRDLGPWDLLKASLTFKRHHQHSKFVWHIAGRQLQFIKAWRGRGGDENDMLLPIPVVSRMYRILRPDTKRIERTLASQEEDLEDA
ncbi:qde-1 RNA-dependent RNA polymerase [Fusarium pseudocircinatum]|uniref:RNA-dependent RNA polymerase n=1 Tax=Fusarium pseudocircinatum TaxID=56676 RepID=A0A8H5L2J7_9HYPO|nr:qde-1 RNA-dependent RNA polymerase [Fusarium pseudocircinatum]